MIEYWNLKKYFPDNFQIQPINEIIDGLGFSITLFAVLSDPVLS
jgi:hypothetical protein